MVREDIIREIQYRLSTLGTVKRNPAEETAATDCPCNNLFEMKDTVKDVQHRSKQKLPVYKREWFVLIESWIVGTTEEAASAQLSAFVDQVRAQLFADGTTLGGKASSVEETELSYVFRPAVPKMAGIGILLQIKYVEDLNVVS